MAFGEWRLTCHTRVAKLLNWAIHASNIFAYNRREFDPAAFCVRRSKSAMRVATRRTSEPSLSLMGRCSLGNGVRGLVASLPMQIEQGNVWRGFETRGAAPDRAPADPSAR